MAAEVIKTARELLVRLPDASALWLVGGGGGAVGLAQWAGWVPDLLTGRQWAILAAVAVFASLLQLYHRLRIERDAFRPNALPDWPLHYAYEHLMGGHFRPTGENASKEMLACMDALHQAARHGQIRIFGRPSTNMPSDSGRPLELIEPEYWRDYKFNSLRLVLPPDEHGPDEHGATTETIGHTILPVRIYEHCRANKGQVLATWPPTARQRLAALGKRLRWHAANISA